MPARNGHWAAKEEEVPHLVQEVWLLLANNRAVCRTLNRSQGREEGTNALRVLSQRVARMALGGQGKLGFCLSWVPLSQSTHLLQGQRDGLQRPCWVLPYQYA